MSRIQRLGLITLAASGVWGLLSASSSAQPVGTGMNGGVVPVGAFGQPCLGVCRPALPPCRVGRRWFGPYGYVCYRPEPHIRPSRLMPL